MGYSTHVEGSILKTEILVIGSGFGGAVAAMRLAQKGYQVLILEKGKRWSSDDFPKKNWNLFKYLWFPFFGMKGIQEISFLKGVSVLHGCGVGGGSLVYANTLLEPSREVLARSCWKFEKKDELEKYFQEAKKMLGVVTCPYLGPADRALKKVSQDLKKEQTFSPTSVGVFFSQSSEVVQDPYFKGDGPDRRGCVLCGGCMVGCRYGAKNTLPYNYLYFAEKWGTRILSETEATEVRSLEKGGFEVKVRSTRNFIQSKKWLIHARQVICSGGVLGTLRLLLYSKASGGLPRLSEKIGEGVRINGEVLVGVTTSKRQVDYSEGIAIGSSFQYDPETKVEAVRYSSGSGFMRMLSFPWYSNLLRSLWAWLKSFFMIRDWAKQTVILLIMRSSEQVLRLRLKKGLFQKKLEGNWAENTDLSLQSVSKQAVQSLSREMKGEPQHSILERALGSTTTAHVLGGCQMGFSPEHAVIDTRHEVFGYPGLYVCDGSVIPTNLGVNPSLTIVALAERMISFWKVHPLLTEKTTGERVIQFSCEDPP